MKWSKGVKGVNVASRSNSNLTNAEILLKYCIAKNSHCNGRELCKVTRRWNYRKRWELYYKFN